MWGLLWGCYFKFLVVSREMESNAERMDPGDVSYRDLAKLATVSKIARSVGTLSKDLSSYVLMKLPCC